MKENIWKIYLLVIPFQQLWYLPYFGYKLQIPEIIFFPLLITAWGNIDKLFSKNFWGKLDIFIVFWPVINLLPCITQGFTKQNILGISGSVYFVILYISIRLILDKRILMEFHKIVIFSSTIAATLGIIGWGLYTFFHIHTQLIIVRPYPYLGTLVQARAFTASPNMLASIIMLGIIFHISSCLVSKKRNNMFSIGILLILSGGFVLTFSKSIICLIAGIIITYHVWENNRISKNIILRNRIIVLFLIILSILIYTLGTHFILTSSVHKDFPILCQMSYISPKPLYTFKFNTIEYGIYGTNYYYNKHSCLKAFIQSNFWGVGAGNYNSFVKILQSQNLHPTTFPQWNPHSTYFGVLAELGIPGLIEVFCLWGIISLVIYKMIQISFGPSHLKILRCGLSGIFLAIAIEAIGTDIVNFRHYWWLLAITREVMEH